MDNDFSISQKVFFCVISRLRNRDRTKRMSINPHFEEKIISGIIVSKTGNSVVIKTPTNGLYNRNISKISKIKRIAKEKNMEVLTC